MNRKVIEYKNSRTERLDKYLSRSIPELSRTKIKRLIDNNFVKVNQSYVKSSYLLINNDVISLEYKEPDKNIDLIKPPHPQNISLDIIYEDSSIIILNKPSGIVVHPGVGNLSGTLVNALLKYTNTLSSYGGIQRPGIVHRLDAFTSGIMVIAKTNKAHINLATQFKNRFVKKKYFAITWGSWEDDNGIINKPLIRKKKNHRLFSVGNTGKESITKYTVIKNHNYLSCLNFFPKTGRTHQIRVHSSSMKRPIFGDVNYGGGENIINGFQQNTKKLLSKILKNFNRHALHAESISFLHPKDMTKMKFEAPIPKSFINLINEVNIIDESN